jgi:hypothetical protein
MPLKTARTLLVATALLIAVVVTVWLAASPPAGDQSGYNVARESRPFGLYSPGTLEELPSDSSRLITDTLGLATIADFQDYTLGLVEELDITWVRLDFLYDGNRFIVPENYLAKLQSNGIEVVGCPRASAPVHKEGLAAYEASLRNLVAEHPSITIWQIESEPSIGAAGIGAYLDSFFAGRQAVAGACPDCRIALAGVPIDGPSQQESLEYYDALLEAIATRHEDEDPPFDIFDIHYYGLAGSSEELLEAFADYQGLLQKHGLSTGVSFWMTECGTYSGQPAYPIGLPAQSEEQQASELVVRFVSVLGAGGERVAWASLYENNNLAGRERGYYDNSGLVYNGLGDEAAQGVNAGTRKAAFEAYRLLVEKLDGFVGISLIAPGQYRFDFSDGRDPLYIVWAVDDAAVADELRGAVRITGLDGAVYESLALELGDEPVFVNRR